MFVSEKEALDIVEAKGLRQVSDSEAISVLVDSVLSENQDKVIEFKSGKDKLFGFFVGQVMRKSEGKANPQLVNQLLRQKLE